MKLGVAAETVLTVLLVSCAIWLGRSPQFYTEALVSAYFALTLIGALIIHMRVLPSWRDALLVVCGTLLFATIDFSLFHFRPALAGWFSFAGLSSLAIMGARAIWSRGEPRKVLLLALVPACLFVVSEYFADDLLKWTSAVHPKAFDLYLYSFDASLRVQIPFAVGRAFAHWPALRVTGVLFYVGLSIPMAVIYAGRLVRMGDKALQCFVAFLSAGPIGVLFYNILPALGPAHLFQRDFPWNPLSFEQASRIFLEPVALAGPRNAIPSLHMAWVLLVWWYSRGLAVWERGIAMSFLIFVALATLGTGEHYFIDLIVAFPFALFIEALASLPLGWTDSKRLAGIAFGFLSTLAWLLSLRFTPHAFWSTPLLPWTLCAATLAFSLYLERQLHRTAEPALPETLVTQAVSAR